MRAMWWLVLGLAACTPADKDVDTDDSDVDTGDTSDTGDTGDTGDTSDSGDTGDTADSGETDETDDTGDTADSGETDETDDTGDTADSGETDETDDTGDTGTPGDRDGDGSPDGVDCDPDDPDVYPGAPEVCDGKVNTCGGAGDVAGTASFKSFSTGQITDVSTSIQGTAAATPGLFQPIEDGRLSLCSGTWYTRIVVNGLELEVVGVDGRDAVTIDTRESSNPAVTVNSGSVATLSGVAIKGGKADLTLSAGAISARQDGTTLVIEDSRIADSFGGSSTAQGGAVVLQGVGTTMTVTDSEFVDNSVHIRATAGTTSSFDNVRFEGARFGTVTLGADATFDQVTFRSNQAGIEVAGPDVDLVLTDCLFEDHETDGDGGGVSNPSPLAITGSASNWTLDVSDTTFRGTNGNGNVGYTVILAGSGTATLTDVVFDQNTATAPSGSPLFVLGGSVQGTRLTFTDNQADNAGGAVNVGSNGSFSCADCTFSGNRAAGNGGALIHGGPVTLTGTTTFEDNVATGDGGAWSSASPQNISLSGTVSFSGNEAGGFGGALAWGPNSGTLSDVTLADVSFTGNSATNGGAVFANWMNLTLSGCTFTDNEATNNGGAVYTRRGVVATGSTFSDNTSGAGGGAYFSESAGGTIGSFTNSTFERNSATNGGAASLFVGGSFTTCDLATGGDDNSPDDVYLRGTSTSYSAFGAGTTVTCTNAVCQ